MISDVGERDDETAAARPRRGLRALADGWILPIASAAARWAPIGAAAGVVVAVPDMARLAASAAIHGSLEPAGFVAAGFLTVGALLGVAVGMSEVVLGRLVGDERDRWRAVVIAVVVAVGAAFAAPRLFGGARISRTPIAGVGPYLLPPLAALAAYVGGRALLAIRRGLRRSKRRRAAIVSFDVALAIGLGTLHQLQFLRYYQAIGVALTVAAWALVVHGLAVAFPAPGTTWGRWRNVATAVVVVIVSALVAQSPSNDVRVALAREAIGFDTFAPFVLRAHGVPREVHGMGDARIAERLGRTPGYGGPPPQLAQVRERLGRANVVFAVIDTLRADRWSRTQARRFPALGRVREECTSFTRAFAPGPSTPVAVPGVFQARSTPDRVHRPALLDAFDGAGYRLGVVAPGIVLRLVRERTTLRPLDDRIDVAAIEDDSAWGGAVAPNIGTRVADAAVSWLRDNARADRSVFLWVHFFSAHQWMFEEGGGTPADRYDRALHDDDLGLARLRQGIDEAGLRDDTILVLISDHGESLGDHGWDTHAVWLYPELIHVPMALCVPGLPAREISSPVGLVSIGPTITDLLGIDAAYPPDGASLAPLVLGGDQPTDAVRPILLESREQRGVIYGDRFLRYTPYTWAIELFALEALTGGPEENLAAREPERAAELLSWIGVRAP